MKKKKMFSKKVEKRITMGSIIVLAIVLVYMLALGVDNMHEEAICRDKADEIMDGNYSILRCYGNDLGKFNFGNDVLCNCEASGQEIIEYDNVTDTEYYFGRPPIMGNSGSLPGKFIIR